MRPSFLTGPSSDLGSGDKELQEVLVQSPMVGQEEVCSEQMSPVTQKAPTELSTQASNCFPTREVFFCASCRAGSLGGSFNMWASCWKLCSKYTLPGGPACTQPWSSEEKRAHSQTNKRSVAYEYSFTFRIKQEAIIVNSQLNAVLYSIYTYIYYIFVFILKFHNFHHQSAIFNFLVDLCANKPPALLRFICLQSLNQNVDHLWNVLAKSQEH